MTAEKRCVDLFIPTKDRAFRAHSLLESAGRYLSQLEKITVSFQASNKEFEAAYELLIQRVHQDPAFETLRRACKEIKFVQRNDLKTVSRHFHEAHNNEFSSLLCDETIFFAPFDFNTSSAIDLLADSQVVFCSLRCGLNNSSQLSRTNNSGIFSEFSDGHYSTLLMHGQPRFISTVVTHHLPVYESESKDYLIWSLLFDSHVPHWGLAASVDGHVYRTGDLANLFDAFGKESFLKIEAGGQFALYKKYVPWAFKERRILLRSDLEFAVSERQVVFRKPGAAICF